MFSEPVVHTTGVGVPLGCGVAVTLVMGDGVIPVVGVA